MRDDATGFLLGRTWRSARAMNLGEGASLNGLLAHWQGNLHKGRCFEMLARSIVTGIHRASVHGDVLPHVVRMALSYLIKRQATKEDPVFMTPHIMIRLESNSRPPAPDQTSLRQSAMMVGLNPD